MPRRSAFTLIELLTVIGIIGLLLAILLPTLSRARAAARGAACLSNLRQASAAGVLRANGHGGYLPLAGVVRVAPGGWPTCPRRSGTPAGSGTSSSPPRRGRRRTRWCRCPCRSCPTSATPPRARPGRRC